MHAIFISYASEDRARVRPLADALASHGWSVWWDRHIPAGKTFDLVIAEALAGARCVVVVWSRNSVASSWVREEADEGRKRGVLIPVLIDEVNPPLGFGRIHAARMIEWDGAPQSEAFQTLATDVAAVIGPPSTVEPARPKPPRRTRENIWRLLHRRLLLHPVRSAARIRVRAWNPQQFSAAALVIALLAVVVIYRIGPRDGDSSHPPPTRTPAGATALRLTAVLADGGKPLANGMTYTIYTAARDDEGNRKRVTESTYLSGPPRLPLPAGRYFVSATNARGTAGAETVIAAVGTQDVQLRIVPAAKR